MYGMNITVKKELDTSFIWDEMCDIYLLIWFRDSYITTSQHNYAINKHTIKVNFWHDALFKSASLDKFLNGKLLTFTCQFAIIVMSY